jgi:hypothetical protein
VFGGRKRLEEVPGLEMICTLGCELGDGPEHVSRPPREENWRSYLGSAPEGTVMFLEWLLRRAGPISAIEALTVERAILEFSTSMVAFAGLENAEGVDALNLPPARLRGTARRFDIAAIWHDRRGRPGLSEKYRLRAAACRAAIPISTEGVSHDG